MKRRARDLRKKQTEAERLLWHHLRNRRLGGCKFRRQHVIGRYIADFVCVERGVVVEVDGGQHLERSSYDAQRSAVLEVEGFRVLRFWNNEVLGNTEAVLEVIARELGE